MAFESSAVRSDFDVKANASNVISSRNREGNLTTATFGTYDVVGINVNNIESMKEAINNYINKVERLLVEFASDSKADAAFRGEGMQAAIDKYLASVKNYVLSVTKTLSDFSLKLDDVKAAYESNIAAQAGIISSVADRIPGDSNNRMTESNLSWRQ